MAERQRQMDPDMAAASRRAAALFTHWRNGGDSAGELAVLGEMEPAAIEWTHLVCALLQVGTNLAEAARDGKDAAYLAYVVREASLDEVSGRG